MFLKNISKEEVNALDLGGYEGRSVVISNASMLPAIFDEINDYPYVGFDTETRPVFRKGVYRDVALCQIAVGDKAYLIRTQHTELTDELLDFLSSPKIKKIGIALRDDIKALQKLRDFNPNGFIDLNEEVPALGIEAAGIRKLTAIILGFRVSKNAQTSNWENEMLTSKQIKYAATDAWVCWKMYNKLLQLGYLDQEGMI